jgi:hypothetical protein
MKALVFETSTWSYALFCVAENATIIPIQKAGGKNEAELMLFIAFSTP